MNDLATVLIFLSLAGLIIGTIKPSIVKIQSRKKALMIFGGTLVFSFVLFGVTSSSSDNSAKDNPKSQTPGQEVQISQEDQIKKIVTDLLKGNNSDQKPRLISLRVTEQYEGGWGVFVEFNADDMLSMDSRKKGIEIRMSEIYTALYTSNQNIYRVNITAHFPLVDKYGNESDGRVYVSQLEKPEADKVNWNTDSSTLKLSILPKVWTTVLLHPDFR